MTTLLKKLPLYRCHKFLIAIALSVIVSLWPLNANAYELKEWINNKTVTGVSTVSNTWGSIQNGYFWQPNGTNYNNYDTPHFTLNSTQSNIEKGSIITLTYTVFSKNNSIPEECLSSRRWDTNLSVVRCDRESFIIDNPDQVDRVLSTMRWQTGQDSSVVTDVLYNNATVADGYSYVVTNFSYYLLTNEARSYNEIVLNGTLAHQESTNSSRLILVHIGGVNFFSAQATLDDVIQYLEDHPDDAGQQMEQNKEETQQAQSDAQSAGNTAQSDASSAGQTLLGALTSFIGAITNASPGNCTLTLNTGYGFNLGDVNLCSISPPTSFQVISSLVVIGFAVPLSISASKKMIELFRGFTG